MKKIFLIHGFGGTPNGGWRSYVMSELNKKEIYACSLPMPTPDNPILNEWIDTLDGHIQRNKHDDLYLVGHSLGASLILRYLETAPMDIFVKGIILVSGPCKATGKPNIDNHIKNFIENEIDFESIKKHIGNAVVIHAIDDPTVTPDNAEIISQGLNAKLLMLSHGGHLNNASGTYTLPEVMRSLEEMF